MKNNDVLAITALLAFSFSLSVFSVMSDKGDVDWFGFAWNVFSYSLPLIFIYFFLRKDIEASDTKVVITFCFALLKAIVLSMCIERVVLMIINNTIQPVYFTKVHEQNKMNLKKEIREKQEKLKRLEAKDN